MLEAIALCEEIAGKRLDWRYAEQNRKGDHIWWISDVRKFRAHYPAGDTASPCARRWSNCLRVISRADAKFRGITRNAAFRGDPRAQ